MRIYDSTDIYDAKTKLKAQEKEWIYNGLDCCVTAEVRDVLVNQLDNYTTSTYAFERDLQAPVLDMRLRGVRVNLSRRDEVVEGYYDTLDRLEHQLEEIVGNGLGLWAFNWRSPADLKLLFYDVLGLPPIHKRASVTVDRNALEKLENYFVATQIVRHLLLMRDLGKKIGFLRTEIDDDGRCRTSYNIAGTTTGRLSSGFSEFGTGTNLQNVEESLRSVFIADEGCKLAYIDAQQGESRCVGAIEGNLFSDWRYLNACEGGDLHTAVAKLIWPSDIQWTGNLAIDRKLAEQPYYRHYNRRFMCKKIGHGTNYGGKPRTLATQAKIEISLVEEFQPRYFRAFPAHRRWHNWVENTLWDTGHIISLSGRKRYFFGRRNDDSTIREAIAYDPQGSLADILDRGMLNVWKHRDATVLMQVHDAVLIQYAEKREAEVIERVLKQLEYPIYLENGRKFLVPYDVATGWNWGKLTKENVDGLRDLDGKDERKRSARVHILDRPIRAIYGKPTKPFNIPKVGWDSDYSGRARTTGVDQDK